MLVWLLACADPRIESVTPLDVAAGDAVIVRGRDLEGACTAELADTGGAIVTLATRPTDGTVVEEVCSLRIPRDLRPGRFVVTVHVGELTRTLPDGITVGRPREEEACTGRFTSNTQVSVPRGEVAIERFFPDGFRDTVRVAIPDIDRVEYEETGPCGAVFLRDRDGGRVLYLDGTPPLEERAKTLARTIDRPLVRVTGS